jgi:hypothetical protein
MNMLRGVRYAQQRPDYNWEDKLTRPEELLVILFMPKATSPWLII